MVVVAFISSSYRLTLFIFMGEKFCPFGVPSSGNYWKPFVGIFFFLFQKRRKVPMKRERKKANDLRKTLKKGKSGWFQARKVDTSPMKSHKARHYVQLPLFAPFLCNISRSTSKARSIWGHLPPCNTFTLTCRIKLATRFLFGWNKTVFIIIYPDEE